MKPTVIAAAAVLLGASVFGGVRLAATSASASSSVKSNLASVPTHMIAAFNLDQPSLVPGAVSDGVQTAFHYDYDPGTDIELAYQQNNVMDINGRISQLMWDYECHRIHTVVTVPPGAWGFCSSDLYPSMDYSNLMASVQSYLQQAAGDSNIHGYWVLDDWPYYDATSAQVLAAIHTLVQQYSPGRPTICGFAAFITQNSYEWQPSLANNFSPQGCDEIAWYVYPDTVSGSMPSASQYTWTMPGLLSKMTADFEARGWNPSQTPLVGIPAAFGGQNKYDGSYQVVPTQQSVATQTQAFCQAGASSIAFYAWGLSDYTNPQDPSDNAGISAGVRQGVSACRRIWGAGPTRAHTTRERGSDANTGGIRVGRRENGRTLTLHTGRIVTVVLTSTVWTFRGSSNPRVLAQLAPAVVVRTASTTAACIHGGCGKVTARFRAGRPGRARVTATRVSCGGAMRCTGSAAVYRFTVVVSPHMKR
jgi:hypothetical protein